MRFRIALAGAVLIVAASFALNASRFSPVGRWEASDNDPADYRFVAEYFWNVPFRAETYDRVWSEGWGTYLRTVPFRGIALGTAYLAIGALRFGHAPATEAEIVSTGLVLSRIEKFAFAIAVLTAFAAVFRRCGAWPAFLTLALLVFPTHVWRFFDDFLAEPVTRILFVLAFACTVAMTDRRSTERLAFALAAIFLCAAQLKVQWHVGALLLLLALLVQFGAAGVPRRLMLLLAVAFAAIPISVIAVDWIGWRTTTLSPGLGLHTNLRYDGDVLRQFTAATTRDPSRPPFANPEKPWLRWWNIYIGVEATRADYEALDRFASGYLRTHPAAVARAFIEGLARASTVPAITRVERGIVRLVPLPRPWSIVIRCVDVVVWVLLAWGLAFAETRLPCALALVLWIVPALGNIVSPYELRYHMPMAGIGAAAAGLVVAEALRRRGPAKAGHSVSRSSVRL